MCLQIVCKLNKIGPKGSALMANRKFPIATVLGGLGLNSNHLNSVTGGIDHIKEIDPITHMLMDFHGNTTPL